VPNRVLVVIGDALQRKLIRHLLIDAGHAAAAVSSSAAAVSLLDREGIDLLMLDGSLLGPDSLAFCRHLRAEHAALSILFLTVGKDVEANIAAFDAGVDDCLAMPFHPRELLARAGALLRRQDGTAFPNAVLTCGGLTLDASLLAIRLSNGRSVPLAPLEMRLLRYLIQHAGHVLGRDAILRTVWGQEESESNLLDVHIGRLRRKLAAADAPASIETVRSLGYRFRAHPLLPAVGVA
jgi:two-component system OmpR family response regulator